MRGIVVRRSSDGGKGWRFAPTAGSSATRTYCAPEAHVVRRREPEQGERGSLVMHLSDKTLLPVCCSVTQQSKATGQLEKERNTRVPSAKWDVFASFCFCRGKKVNVISFFCSHVFFFGEVFSFFRAKGFFWQRRLLLFRVNFFESYRFFLSIFFFLEQHFFF